MLFTCPITGFAQNFIFDPCYTLSDVIEIVPFFSSNLGLYTLLSACKQCTVKDFKGFKSFCSGFEEEVLLHYREVKFFPRYN